MFRKFSSTVCSILLGALVITGCVDKSGLQQDPKTRLTEYISASFSVKTKDDRKNLIAYLTDEAKVRLESWSDEQFQAAFIDSKRQFVKLNFKEVKQISTDRTAITYELTFLDQGKGTDARVTNKKHCEMRLDRGQWMISSVQNIKELIEYKNEMALP